MPAPAPRASATLLGHQLGGPVPSDAAPPEPFERRLVAGGDEYLRPRPRIGRVGRLDLLGRVGQEPGRPQCVGQVAPLRPQLVGETSVQHNGAFGERVAEGTAGRLVGSPGGFHSCSFPSAQLGLDLRRDQLQVFQVVQVEDLQIDPGRSDRRVLADLVDHLVG